MRVGRDTLSVKSKPNKFKAWLIITILVSTLAISGCSKNVSEAPVSSSGNSFFIPSDEELMVLLESCGQETYQGVKALIRDIEVNDQAQLKIDFQKFNQIEKDTGPICVVARSPINKFTSQIEING